MLLGNNQNNIIRPTYINAIYIRNVKLRNLHLIKALCTVQLHFGEKIGHTFLHPTNCSSCYLRSICIGQRSIVFVCIKQYTHYTCKFSPHIRVSIESVQPIWRQVQLFFKSGRQRKNRKMELAKKTNFNLFPKAKL